MINWESWGFLGVIVNQYTKGSQMMKNGSTLRAGTMEILFEDINENIDAFTHFQSDRGYNT